MCSSTPGMPRESICATSVQLLLRAAQKHRASPSDRQVVRSARQWEASGVPGGSGLRCAAGAGAPSAIGAHRVDDPASEVRAERSQGRPRMRRSPARVPAILTRAEQVQDLDRGWGREQLRRRPQRLFFERGVASLAQSRPAAEQPREVRRQAEGARAPAFVAAGLQSCAQRGDPECWASASP